MTTAHKTPLLIIGSGPAGYTAAIYAARANLQPILVQGMEPGGQLMTTTDVENFPGFRDVIQGPFLMEEMRMQAEKVGTKIITDMIVSVDFSGNTKVCIGESGDRYEADAVIIATGAQAIWLGLDSETKYRGYGVSGCATCDGFFFRQKEVVVIGGGNTAVEDAMFLTHFATKVYLVHRRDQLRAEKLLQKRLFENPKIEVIWDSVLEEVLGTEAPLSVTGVRIKNIKTMESREIKVDGVFVAIGHKPATGLFKDVVETDGEGYIKCSPGSVKTNVPGVFAAGDVQDKIYRQAITAAGQGCMAALDVERYLAK